ncbi:MAG: hypothetical protein JSS49_03940 [Planctomycetes bacterium]|nr:hypothetical protein [Planctomycetota bacterium]
MHDPMDTCPAVDARSIGSLLLRAGLLIVILSTTATAQNYRSIGDIDSAGLTVEATAGWGGIVDSSAPVPISLLLQNSSDRNIEGVLKLTDQMRGFEVTVGDLFISPGASRRVTSIQSLSNWYECTATLEQGGKILWSRELNIAAGQFFDRNINVALFIDEGGRNLQLPGAMSVTNKTSNLDVTVAGLTGHPVRCVTAKPWQVPNHPGPLVIVRAMVFPDGAEEKDLNRTQWLSVAEWVCQGGTVFVENESRQIVDRLVESAPLQAEIPTQSGPFTVHRVGLGSIQIYSGSLLSSESTELRQNIAVTSAFLARNQINTFADAGYLTQSRQGRTLRNRVLVFALFALYTLLVAVALALFRFSQRQVAGYTIVVVVGASILSGLLGGYLRLSKGDLVWTTVTQPGIGGLIQVGSLEVQSAGSRNTRVAVTGRHADLQFIGSGLTQNRYVYGYGYSPPSSGYSPFTWQQNQGPVAEDACQIHVPMTLWGHGRCHAVAYRSELQRLDFELDFQPRTNPDNKPDATKPPQPLSGLLTVKLRNHLPFDLTNCWLVVGTSQAASPAESISAGRTQYYGGYLQRQPNPVDGLIDVYSMQQVKNLPSGVDHEQEFSTTFHNNHQLRTVATGWPFGSRIPPTISQMGTPTAWIIGTLEKSPILAIDESNSDFSELEGTHLFIQEILPEDVPATLRR